jgi:hypothetical protein
VAYGEPNRTIWAGKYRAKLLPKRLAHSSFFLPLVVLLAVLPWNIRSWHSLNHAIAEHRVAAKTGDLIKIQAPLKDNPDLLFSRNYDNYEYMPLHNAAELGDKDLARLLLAHKAEVNSRNKYGSMPLSCAALDHVRRYNEELKAAGIRELRMAPMLLPDYSNPAVRKRQITTDYHGTLRE